MAPGGLWIAPFPGVVGLCIWLFNDKHRERWHLFDGWCASIGVDPEQLSTDRLLNLIHFYIIERTKPEEHRKINDQLVGPLRTTGEIVIEKEWMPSWWHGDEEASQSSLDATRTLTRRRKRK